MTDKNEIKKKCCNRGQLLVGKLNLFSTLNQPNPTSTVPTTEVINFNSTNDVDSANGVIKYHFSDNSISAKKDVYVQLNPQYELVKSGDNVTPVPATFYAWLRIKKKGASTFLDVPNTTVLTELSRPTDSILLSPTYALTLQRGDRLQFLSASTNPNNLSTVASQNVVGTVVLPFAPSAHLSVLAFSKA